MDMNGDLRREEARRLRVDPGMSRSQLMERFGVGNGTLTEWLRGLDPPGWTQRPNAKDDLREMAIAMRREGCSVPQIAADLRVSKSTAYLWIRHIPLDRTPAEREERQRRHMEHMREARWAPYRKARDADRGGTGRRLAEWVGELTDREVLLVGAVAYWCEGAKEKPWNQALSLQFITSDPRLVLLFLRYVELLGVEPAGADLPVEHP